MPDSLRGSDTPDVSAISRDSQIEGLLLTGLDHYFSGQHELAISVWTRVLFLDRNHPRARAYIERARGAIAERQREAEELLQTGVAAFQRGDTADARRLLSSAVERGVRPEEPLALLERLARLAPAAADRTTSSPETAVPAQQRRGRERHPPEDSAAPHKSRAAGFAIVLVIGVAAGALIVLYATTGGLNWPAPAPAPISTQTQPAQDPLPMPSAAEVSLARAQTLVAAGRSRDALRALDEIRPGDALKPQADRLRADIQERLLLAARASGSTGDR